MWENMGDPIDNERKVKLNLATFEGLINSIDDLKCDRTGEKGELMQWRVELFHGDKLGYITALPIDDMLYIRFYRMERDVPRKRIIIGNKDGTVWDSGPDEPGDMHLVAGSDDVWESKQATSSAAPYIMVRKVDMALANYGAVKAQAHQVNGGKEHGLNTAQIFLSYAREDEEKIENLYQKLSDVGLKPWMAKKDLIGGERWKSRISQAIRRSALFLACLSANSIDKRGWVQREIKDALDIWREKLESDIYLIPVRLEECEVPESLRDFQWVNLFEEDGWTRLVKAIQIGMACRAEVTRSISEKDLKRVQRELLEASRESWPGPGFIGSGPRETEARELLAEATNNTYQVVMDWQERFVYYLLLKSGGKVASHDFLEFAFNEFVSTFPSPKPAGKTQVLSALGELSLKGFIKAPPDFTPGTEIAIVQPFPYVWTKRKFSYITEEL